MTLWNLGDRVRRRDYQCLLHCVSLSEKDQVLEFQIGFLGGRAQSKRTGPGQ